MSFLFTFLGSLISLVWKAGEMAGQGIATLDHETAKHEREERKKEAVSLNSFLCVGLSNWSLFIT